MAFDFPSSPTPGSVYSPAGGPSYTWDGQKWMMTGSAITYTPAYDQRNRIVNPSMAISQENGSTAGTTTNYYAVDQWYLVKQAGVTGTMSLQQTAGPTPQRSKNYLRLFVTAADTSVAATDWVYMVQTLEGIRVADFGWGTAQAQQVILRFGWKGPAGTYSVGLQNRNSGRSYAAPFTISAGQANTDTTQTIAIPGDPSGALATGTAAALDIIFTIMGGSNAIVSANNTWLTTGAWAAIGQSNGMDTVNNAFFLSDVGLYLDPTGSGIAPAWEMPDEADELAACQRYYQTSLGISSPSIIGGYTSSAGAAWYSDIQFTTTMRTNPATVTFTPVSPLNITSGPTLGPASTGGFRYAVVANAVGAFNCPFNWVASARM